MNQFSQPQQPNPAQSIEGTLDVTASLVQSSLEGQPVVPVPIQLSKLRLS